MRKILVGYDGSDTAARAAEEAAVLVVATGAEIHFITVVDDERIRHGMSTTEEHDRLEEHAAAMTRRLVSTENGGLADRLTGFTTVIKVVSGSPAQRIVEYAQAIDADLIVVGNRRVQGIERLLGSVAIPVLRHAHCSVYVAHSTS